MKILIAVVCGFLCSIGTPATLYFGWGGRGSLGDHAVGAPPFEDISICVVSGTFVYLLIFFVIARQLHLGVRSSSTELDSIYLDVSKSGFLASLPFIAINCAIIAIPNLVVLFLIFTFGVGFLLMPLYALAALVTPSFVAYSSNRDKDRNFPR